MSVVRFANNLSLMTQQGGSGCSITTDPHPMGGMNYADVRVNTEVLDQHGGTAQVDVSCEVSNDGQTFSPQNALDVTGIATPGVNSIADSAPFAFIRFRIELSVSGGSAGDSAWTTLDVHVNFTHS